MLRAGKHLNSLHCVGMSTDSTQFGQLAHLFFFPTLRQPKTLSVFGEEAKNFLLMTLQSISIITHLFVSEKNMENPLSTSNGLSQCRSCFFLNPQVMVRSSTLLPFMPCWTVGGPVWTPKPTSCETAQLPTHPTGKTCCKIGHQKSFKWALRTSISYLYQWTTPKKSVGDASIGSVFHWQNITSRVRTINRNVMASWTDATVVARPLHYRRRVQNGALNINEFQLMRSRVLFKPWIRLKKWQVLHKLIWSIFNRFLPISCPKLQYELPSKLQFSLKHDACR